MTPPQCADPADSVESQDSDLVDQAVQFIADGDPDRADRMLADVTGRAPKDYVYQYDGDEQLFVKFWDINEFTHFLLWNKKIGREGNVTWLKSAYPRALFFRGFLRVAAGRNAEAFPFLDEGRRMEPTNPRFALEKAQALARMGNLPAAMELYSSVNEIGPYVSAHNLALAIRGQGFVLIEMGRLDAAEDAFRWSQKYDPESQVAAEELIYIRHLREGGGRAPADMVVTSPTGLSHCANCRIAMMGDGGTIIEVDGRPLAICRVCRRKLTKRWWEFWK
jgi:tetratricopeptide (TPR) repeat protein